MPGEIRSYSNDSLKRKSALRALIIEISIVVALILVVIFTLIYFNIISFDRITSLFNNPFTQEEVESVEVEEIDLEEYLPFAPCAISLVDECLKGKIIDRGEEFYGVGYEQIHPGVEVRAIMAGNVQVERNGNINTVTISDELGVQETTLNFVGEAFISDGQNSVGYLEVIGRIGEKVNSEPKNILTVSSKSTISNQYARIKISEENGSYLINRLNN